MTALKYNADLLNCIDEDTLPNFYNLSQFKFLEAIENKFYDIYIEYKSIIELNSIYQKWPQDWIVNDSNMWEIIPIKQIDNDNHHAKSEILTLKSNFFPTTLNILQDAIGDKLCDVAFSRLQPGTHILPHRGKFSNTLRCHLGLQIPDGECIIKVRNETRKWEQGKILILDDRLTHEVWNQTESERIVLIFDFVPDSLTEFFK